MHAMGCDWSARRNLFTHQGNSSLTVRSVRHPTVKDR